jgi:hypothetical protein
MYYLCVIKLQDMNIASYIIYILLTSFITIVVGFHFYTNGRIYILTLFKYDEVITNSVNNLLLVLYYLLNIGYAAVMIHFWVPVISTIQMLSVVGIRVGRIIIIFSIIHYFNMAILYLFSKKNTFNHS